MFYGKTNLNQMKNSLFLSALFVCAFFCGGTKTNAQDMVPSVQVFPVKNPWKLNFLKKYQKDTAIQVVYSGTDTLVVEHSGSSSNILTATVCTKTGRRSLTAIWYKHYIQAGKYEYQWYTYNPTGEVDAKVARRAQEIAMK